MSNFAVDTNILIYLHELDPDSTKRRIAAELIADSPVISSQVVSEYLNVCHRRLRMTKEESLDALMGWLPLCTLATFELAVFSRAVKLVEKYKFQMFDAVVAASAILADCSVLYSEDFQHNFLVENQLRIINPFYKNSNGRNTRITPHS